MSKKIKHYGIRCDTCGEALFSYHRHDFRYCGCGSCHVDGGFDYLRYGGAGPHTVISRKFSKEEVEKGLLLANTFRNLEVEDYQIENPKDAA